MSLESPGDDIRLARRSDDVAYVVPGALAFFTQAFPALKRWAFLCVPSMFNSWEVEVLFTT